MPARRRRSLYTLPTQRTQIWDAKMNPDIYKEYLQATKPKAIQKVAKYQATFQLLLNIVKEAIAQHGENPNLTQEYMWYAEKLWKLTQTYHSEALKREANSIFLSYLAKGRDEILLRKIASALGIRIEDTDVIIEEITLKVIAKDTIKADGTEQTILEYIPEKAIMTRISGYIDLQNMTEGDIVEIKAYTKIAPDAPYKLYQRESYSGTQTQPAIHFLPRLSGYAFKVTIQQTQGTYKTFSYVFTKGG